MSSRRGFLLSLPAALLPLPAYSQALTGVVHELSGEVTLNDFPLTRSSALQPGQTIRTGASGRIWFTLGMDAYFLRPNSTLRLQASRPREPVIDFLRLITGAIGATFPKGVRRSIVSPTATIGIRGTGVYVEASEEATYACTCFGATEIQSSASGAMMENVQMAAENHVARRILRQPASGARIVQAGFERHTNEEIARLESLAGRPNPFRS